jgi:hypothetical protein
MGARLVKKQYDLVIAIITRHLRVAEHCVGPMIAPIIRGNSQFRKERRGWSQ